MVVSLSDDKTRLRHGDIRLKQLLADDTYYSPQLDGVHLIETILRGNSFNYGMLSSWSIQDSNLVKCDFDETHIDTLVASGAWIDCDFVTSTMNACRFIDQKFQGCIFEDKSIITATQFKNVVFSNCIFDGVRFENCLFSGVVFRNCEFRGMYDSLRTQKNRLVLFAKCTFTKVHFQNTGFRKRFYNPNLIENDNIKFSTRFMACNTSGTLFSGCNTEGMDTSSLGDCIFDSGSILTDNDTEMVDEKQNVTEPLPALSDSVASQPAPQNLKMPAPDEDFDEYDDEYAMLGWGGMYGGGGRGWNSRYNYKPKNTGKPHAFRFFTSGLGPSKSKANG